MKRDPAKAKAWRERSKPMKRTAIAAAVGAPAPRRRRMRPVSGKMAERRAAARGVRLEYLLAHPWCEIPFLVGQIIDGCTGSAVDVHEPWTRGRGGPIDDLRNMVALCRNCHDWIGQTVEGQRFAKEYGFLVSSAQGPAWLERGGRNA